MIIPYGIQSYKRADLPQIRLENLYVEQVPSEPNKLALLPRPGLKPYQTIGDGPIRGIFQQPGSVNGMLFTVSRRTLYAGSTSLGNISGSGRVSMAATTNVLLVANSTQLYSSDGATLDTVAFPDGAGVTSVGFLDGYALAARAGTRHVYFTLDPATWDGLDFFSAEQSTGNVIGIKIVGDALWIFCEKVTEVFVPTGDSDAPFQRVDGRLFDKGALARDSAVDLDNSVFWVGHDGIVYRGDSTPKRVSDHGIEERIAESDAADISAWAFPWFGHNFYVLNTSQGTFFFDVATQQWTSAVSYGRPRFRAAMGLLYGRTIIAGDDETNQIWALDATSMTDDDVPIERYFTVIITDSGFIDNISLDCSIGEVADNNIPPGIIEMRTSRDDGQNFLPWKQKTLGKQGHTRAIPNFRKLGFVDQGNMLIQFRITDARPSRISYIKVNEAMGGRAR